jgi:hypothetical protein
MFTIFLNNVRFFLSIFTFIHHHVAHLVVLSIYYFHFVPHVLVFSRFLRGSSKVGSFGYSKDFVVISHILFNMLEVNVYLIIVSKVFGVTIIINFHFSIVK